MSITATFSFDPWEHYRVGRVVTRESRSAKFLYGMLLLLLIVLLLPWLLLGEPFVLRNLWSFGVFAAIIFIVIPLLQLRAAFAHRTIHGPPHTFHGVELHDKGVRVYCDHSSTDINWVAIHKARETSEFFLIYHAKNCACYLPKRALDAEQGAKVRELLQLHLGERAGLKPHSG